LASPFLPPAQLPGFLSRIAVISRRTTKSVAPATSGSSAGASASDGSDATLSEILAVAQSSSFEVCDMARIGAATAAVLPLLPSTKKFSCMRPHARAAAAALVLSLDDHLIEELCRSLSFCSPFLNLIALMDAPHVDMTTNASFFSLLSQSEEPLFFEFILEARKPSLSKQNFPHCFASLYCLSLMILAAARCDAFGCAVGRPDSR
jgi:hypothetical protein